MSEKTSVRIKFPTNDFKLFLKSILNINNSIILKIKDSKATVFTSGQVVPIIVLNELQLDIDKNIEIDLPISDISILMKICEFADSDEFELDIKDNLVKFNGNGLKYKFHLADSKIIGLPKTVTIEKFNSFPIVYTTSVSKHNINKLGKGISLIKSSNIKIYFSLEEDGFYGELTDKDTSLMDSFSVKLNDERKPEDNLEGNIPISLDAWTLLNLLTDNLTFSVSSVKTRLGMTNILFITQETNKMKCTYFIQSLKSNG